MTKPTKWHVRPAKTQISHPPSLTSLRCPHEETFGPQLPIERTAKTDQTGRMPRLIWVFAGRIGHIVGFVMRWPTCNYFSCSDYSSTCYILQHCIVWVSTVLAGIPSNYLLFWQVFQTSGFRQVRQISNWKKPGLIRHLIPFPLRSHLFLHCEREKPIQESPKPYSRHFYDLTSFFF